MRMIVLTVTAFAVMLAQPASADETIKSVGIISAIGDTITKQHVGVVVFGNKTETEAIDSWQVDEFVIAEISAQLTGLYEIKPVTYAKTDFLPGPRELFADSDVNAEASIKHVTPAPGAEPDAYIVVTKTYVADDIGRTNQLLFGLGFYDRSDGTQAVYAAYEVSVVDGHTLKHLTRLYPRNFLNPDYDRVVHLVIGNGWGDNFTMTPEQRDGVREIVKQILRGGIANAPEGFWFQTRVRGRRAVCRYSPNPTSPCLTRAHPARMKTGFARCEPVL